MPHTTTRLSFDVVGSITQEVEILDKNVTPEQLAEGLNKGDYLTTLEISRDESVVPTICRFDDTGNEVTVAVIVSQTAGEDNVYSRFQVEGDE